MADNTIPPWFSGGEVAEKLNSWLSYLLVRLPISGLNTTALQTANGRAINAKQGGSGGGVTPYPWKITASNVGTMDTPDWKARLLPGSLNSIIPTNIFDSFSLGAGVNFVKLSATTDGTNVTTSSIVVDAGSAPVDPLEAAENMAPLSFVDVLGMVNLVTVGDATAATVFQVRYNNLNATPVIAFLESQEPGDPGEEPFLRWWKWQINEAF